MQKNKRSTFFNTLLVPLLIVFLILFIISFMVTYIPNGDFKVFKKTYWLALRMVVISSFLGCSYVFYIIVKDAFYKSKAVLHESIPITTLYANKTTWRKAKAKEFLKKHIHFLVKNILIFSLIALLLFLIAAESLISAIALGLIILIFAIPMVYVNLKILLQETKNQLYQKEYKVDIYKNGLTINNKYYPFNHYRGSQNNLRLVDVEQLSQNGISIIKFTSISKFRSSSIPGGGDFGTVLERKKILYLPILLNQDVTLTSLKKQLKTHPK